MQACFLFFLFTKLFSLQSTSGDKHKSEIFITIYKCNSNLWIYKISFELQSKLFILFKRKKKKKGIFMSVIRASWVLSCPQLGWHTSELRGFGDYPGPPLNQTAKHKETTTQPGLGLPPPHLVFNALNCLLKMQHQYKRSLLLMKVILRNDLIFPSKVLPR